MVYWLNLVILANNTAMLKPRKSFSKTYLFYMHLILSVAFCLVGYFWINGSVSHFQQEAQELREKYVEQQKTHIRSQVERVASGINFQKKGARSRLKKAVKSRTLEAYNIIDYIYNNNRDKSKKEVLALIHQSLTPMRWNENGRGYYVLLDTDGVMRLNPALPFLEGTTVLDLKGNDGQCPAKKMLKIIREEPQAEGFLEFLWSKPPSKEKKFPKTMFIKLYAPLNLIVMSGEYIEDVAHDVQQEILQRIAKIHYGPDGYMFVLSHDGIMLSTGADPSLIGTDMLHVKNNLGEAVVPGILDAALTDRDNFICYNWPKPNGSGAVEKITYVKSIPEWKWIVGSGTYLDGIDTIIAERRAQLQRINRDRVIGIIAFLLISLLITTFISLQLSKRLDNMLHLFSDFFKTAAQNSVHIDAEKINVKEFYELALHANNMIEARQQTEHELVRARILAEEANLAKSRFLANMSHEIRTPMNGIMGMTDLTLETDLTTIQRRNLTMVQKSAKRLMAVINDILDFSKIEAGKMQLEERSFNLRTVIDAVVSLLTIQAEQKGLKMHCHLERSLPKMVIGDSGKIRQILLNLIGNSIKFTATGSITITVRQATPPEITFAISDTGIGISKKNRDSIFTAFHQEDNSNTRQFGGTGLGLTISMNLVQLLGGTLRMESEEGVGSTFSFTLPLQPAPELEPPEGTEQAASTPPSAPKQTTTTPPLCPEGQHLNILIADDEDINRLLAKQMLKADHVHIFTAENGKQVLEFIEKQDIDLILMDLQMPEMDGLQTTQRIRHHQQEKLRQIKIVAMTAHAFDDDYQKCMDVGMNGYVAKPIARDALYGAINALFPS